MNPTDRLKLRLTVRTCYNWQQSRMYGKPRDRSETLWEFFSTIADQNVQSGFFNDTQHPWHCTETFHCFSFRRKRLSQPESIVITTETSDPRHSCIKLIGSNYLCSDSIFHSLLWLKLNPIRSYPSLKLLLNRALSRWICMTNCITEQSMPTGS